MIELAILKAIEEGRPKWFLCLLACLSKIFSLCVRLRNFAYDHHLLKETKVNSPVVSIGNIKAGGTGKTPFCIHLASALADHQTCAVLYRGYRLDKKNGMTDEAMLLKEKVPKAAIYIGKNRAKLAQTVKADIILLDDGMQHRKLYRDKEIVCMQAEDLFGGGRFLPRGLLRDDPKQLKRADLIVLDTQNEEGFQAALLALKKYTQAPVIGVKKQVAGWCDQKGNHFETLPYKKIAYFCGIANPKSFEKMLLDSHFQIIDKWILKDHASFDSGRLQDFYEKAKDKGAQVLVCTEKDIVKLRKCHLQVFAIVLKLDVIFGTDIYEKFIQGLN